MNFLDILKKQQSPVILDLLKRGVSKLGQTVGNITPIASGPKVADITNSITPNSGLNAFLQGNSEDIIPNIASTLRTQGQNMQTPEGQLGMVAGVVDAPVALTKLPQKVIELAKASRNVQEFGRKVSKEGYDVTKGLKDVFNDKTNPINTLEDAFNSVSLPQPVRSISLKEGDVIQEAPVVDKSKQILEGEQFAKDLNSKNESRGFAVELRRSGDPVTDFVAKDPTKPNLLTPNAVEAGLSDVRNEFGLKDASTTYRQAGKLTQWTDNTGSTLEEAKNTLAQVIKDNPSDKFVLKKIGSGDEGFYRIYKESRVAQPSGVEQQGGLDLNKMQSMLRKRGK